MMILLGLASVFAGVAVLVATALGALTEDRIRDRLAPYAVTTAPGAADGHGADGHGGYARIRHGTAERAGVLGSHPALRPAVDLAERAVAGRGLEAVLATRLEAAALPLRAPEWLVLHAGAAAGGGVLLLALSGGGLPAATFGLFVGLVGPWLVLTVRQGRREKAFLAQLPDTLQLMSGSLKAGHSMLQAVDTAVRQTEAPMAAELHRALVESQLGVPMEDALERIGDRLRSDDFSWVVMAIRIQRDVGGNLAQLLTSVAGTLRERERLRGQVDVLSAEGKLSGIILGLLPVGFAAYLLVARPGYLAPLLSPLGLMMLLAAVVLLVVGGLWVAKVVAVEV
jgi:tight adherence protein B